MIRVLGSALYGTNAFMGVIDIITDTSPLGISLKGGSFNAYSGSR